MLNDGKKRFDVKIKCQVLVNYSYECLIKKISISKITNKIDLVLFNWKLFACSSNIVSISNGNMEWRWSIEALSMIKF